MAKVTSEKYGTMPDGRTVQAHILTNETGAKVQIIDYGATIAQLFVPDNNGVSRDVVLGFDTLEGWTSDANACFNAVPGRVAGRIAKGKFSLDGKEYNLPINDGTNHIHGGPEGFHKRVWTPINEGLDASGNPYVTLQYEAKDNEAGYPGNVTVTVTYTLDARKNRLTCHMKGTTDRPTVLNITNHGYFNLSGMEDADILSHQAYINAERYYDLDSEWIPTGHLVNVRDTEAMSFLESTAIGARVKQTPKGIGYDQCYELQTGGDAAVLAARVTCPKSHIGLELYTNQPGVQLYTAYYLDGTIPVKETQRNMAKPGAVYPSFAAFCLETQRPADAINHATFPSPILRPGETYDNVQVFSFTIEP